MVYIAETLIPVWCPSTQFLKAKPFARLSALKSNISLLPEWRIIYGAVSNSSITKTQRIKTANESSTVIGSKPRVIKSISIPGWNLNIAQTKRKEQNSLKKTIGFWGPFEHEVQIRIEIGLHPHRLLVARTEPWAEEGFGLGIVRRIFSWHYRSMFCGKDFGGCVSRAGRWMRRTRGISTPPMVSQGLHDRPVLSQYCSWPVPGKFKDKWLSIWWLRWQGYREIFSLVSITQSTKLNWNSCLLTSPFGVSLLVKFDFINPDSKYSY